MSSATAFAPATTGNAAVGFDVLGFAANVIGDTVTVHRVDQPGVRVLRISDSRLPTAATENTASVALLAMIDALGLDFGFNVEIDKGIPLGSGLGGSAASAVGAVVAANRLLDEQCSNEQLFGWALAGEAVASGHAHPDNVAPCLYGGLTLTTARGVRVLPVPAGVHVGLTHPHMSIETRVAREILPREIPLALAVEQMGHLAAFVDAAHRGDAEAFVHHCRDLIVQPHRKALIPGFDEVQAAAFAAGAQAFSLSGSGPTVFALSLDLTTADAVARAVEQAFPLDVTGWVCELGTAGAEVQ